MTEKEFCKGCVNEKYKDYLTSCSANLLSFHWTEFLKCLPIIGKYIETYKCKRKETL